MKREIKPFKQLIIQAEFERLGRIERIIIESLIKNDRDVFIPNYLCSDFVKSELGKDGYKLVQEYIDKMTLYFPTEEIDEYYKIE